MLGSAVAPAPRIPRRSATLAAILGWILPGLGQAYVGRPVKALFFLAVIGGTYLFGLQLSGWLCVNPDRDPIWFAAQSLAGGPTAAAAWWTRGLMATSRIPTYEVGLLYVTVAALLNAVAIADAIGTVDEYDRARIERALELESVTSARLADDPALDVAAGAHASAGVLTPPDAPSATQATPEPLARDPLGSPFEPLGSPEEDTP